MKRTLLNRLLALAPHITKEDTLEIVRCTDNDELIVFVERRERETTHIVGGIYPAIETAYGRTVDHGFNIRIF